MPAFPIGAIARSMMALATVAALTFSANANAQTTRPVHHKVHVAAPRRPYVQPLAPGTELQTSTYANPGSENHYYSDTVASSHAHLMDLDNRFGQSSAPEYNSTPDALFRF